jgi:TetR/AcrR family transcriptional regulator, transcriptional repressor for nem operon
MPIPDRDPREVLIEAGTRVMTQKSYNGCGLKEILAEAGVPKGSFYYYFKSKEDFGVAIIEQFAEDFYKRMFLFLHAPGQSPLDRLRSCYTYGRNYFRENGLNHDCLIAKLALEHSQLSGRIRKAIRVAYDGWSRLLAEVIAEGQASGEVVGGRDAALLADMLVNAWEGSVMRMQIDQDLKPVDGFIRLMIDGLLAGK